MVSWDPTEDASEELHDRFNNSFIQKTNNLILIGLAFHAVLLSVYETLQYLSGCGPSDRVRTLWQFIFFLMVVMWVDNDSRIHRKSERCFDYLFLVYIFSPVYLPYYFYRTRGFLLGSILMIFFVLLCCLPYIVQLELCFFV